MKVAIFTLTRDRLEYTKHCFRTLKEKTGYPYDHYIVDNGSTDGTKEWLKKQKKLKVIAYNKTNEGISKACNRALKVILPKKYDLIIKVDNDCELVSTDTLKQLVEVYKSIPPFFIQFMLSPKVEGLNNPVPLIDEIAIGGHKIGVTPIIGGIFQAMPAHCYARYKYPINLPKAKGQDEDINAWFRNMGGSTGYVMDLVVNHYETTEGQKQRFPKYFQRKYHEETTK